jgi:hypothetical protein
LAGAIWCNMQCIVDQNGKIVCQYEHIDRGLA